MLEAPLTKSILHKLNKIDGCRARKIHGGGYGAGWPDIIAVKNGHTIFLEVKTPRGKVSKLQAIELAAWHDAGATCAIIRSVNEALQIIHSI